MKSNSNLFTHQGDGVVDAAIDNLSSPAYSDAQRSIVPHPAPNSLPCFKHHHLLTNGNKVSVTGQFCD